MLVLDTSSSVSFKYNGEITLTNTIQEAIHDWTVAFDFPYEITNIWNA